jgi:hypothetical protein
LSTLDLSRSKITNETLKTISNFDKLENLKILDISGCKDIDDEGFFDLISSKILNL